MNRQVRVRGIRRKQLDEDKLAYAFLLLARALREQDSRQDDQSKSEAA